MDNNGNSPCRQNVDFYYKEIIMTTFYLLNLQIFANTVINATTSNTVGNDLSIENKTYYDMVLIKEAQAELVHDQFGQKKPIPKNGGKTIEFRKFASLPKATTPLTEGVTPVGAKLDVSHIEATVSQYGNFLEYTDMLELTTIDDVVQEGVELNGRNAGSTLDTITRNYLHAGTNVNYCPKLAADGTETEVTSRSGLDATCRLTVDVINQIVAKLRACNAKTINGDYVAIIHPFVAYDLMKDEAWVDAHKYAQPENIYNGEIGKIGGVRFVQTSEALIIKDDTCPEGLAVFSTLFIADNAYGVTEITGGGLQTIIKQLGSAGSADPLNQRATIGWKATKVAEILVQQYLVRAESCSPRYSATAVAN